MSEGKDWESFAIGERRVLGSVVHYTHLPAAQDIAKDGILRARLPSDCGICKGVDAHVVWLAPKQAHANGAYFGNVCISFDFKSISGNMRYYWAGAKKSLSSGSRTICRFLISDKDYPSLVQYDPERDNGPLKLDGGSYFWDGPLGISIQLMIEGDIPLSLAQTISFEEHTTCKTDASCMYTSMGTLRARDEFVARLLKHKIRLDWPGLIKEDMNGRREPSPTLKAAWWENTAPIGELSKLISSRGEWGTITASDSEAPDLGRLLACSLMGPGGSETEQRELLMRFANRKDAMLGILQAIAEATRTPYNAFIGWEAKLDKC